KTSERFAKADGDKSATLTPEEFVLTRIARKSARPAPCVPESEG
ncbi:MAG: histidine kinase, partial [Hyphomicrobiales bacterium]